MPKKRRIKKVAVKKSRTKVKKSPKRVPIKRGNGTIRSSRKSKKPTKKPTKKQILSAKKQALTAKKKYDKILKEAGLKTKKKKQKTPEEKLRYKLLVIMGQENPETRRQGFINIAEDQDMTPADLFTWCLYNGFSIGNLIW